MSRMRQLSLGGLRLLAKLRNRRENVVLRGVQEYLTVTSIFHVRMNTGALPDRSGRLVHFGATGMADILALPCPMGVILPVWIETKSTRGRQSSAQKMFQKLVEGYGHTYLLVREVSELADFFSRNQRER